MITCPYCNREFELQKNSEQPAPYDLTAEETQQANAKVTAMIDAARTKQANYVNREKIPQPYLAFCDAYVEAVGKDDEGNYLQEPIKKVLFYWIGEFETWTQARLTPEHIKRAYEYATRPEGGFPVSGPGALTKTAIAMKSQPAISKKQVRTQSKIDMLRNRESEEE